MFHMQVIYNKKKVPNTLQNTGYSFCNMRIFSYFRIFSPPAHCGQFNFAFDMIS